MALINSQGQYLIHPTIALETKRQTTIPNSLRMQRHSSAMQAAKTMWESFHSSVQARSLSSVYNCMGMVFASRRTDIDPDHLRMILADDGYHQLMRKEDLHFGDIVVYEDHNKTVSHVGIVADIRPNFSDASQVVTVLSQWGGDGEYFHLIDAVPPQLGQPSEYWTDRI